MKFSPFSQTKLGSSLSLPAHGRVGARAKLLFLAAHFAKQNTNSVGVQSEGEAEGGCGGFRRARAEAKPRRPARSEQTGWRVVASGGGAERQFRSKWVRAFSNKAHQIGLPDFLWGEAEVCSPRLRARLARNWAVKSNGGAKSQTILFSEMRRFVITKLCIKINFYSNFLRKISREAGSRRFFVPSPNISHAKI
ncbi:MAG: hypothetical protein US45_C0040G0008 [Candidatus Nomurabacteria bacterium GW2011_GWA1_37_20]|uniref:Uncharacterized protein n=1 Tax=Candidatus Nomurabacteria bacterium GW2011_GWA1_37_20 TaxID=1618729 RepID=A0A0G0JU26_9BACT|nr:MAG: hypothetical protein US45_C0040G0008 [Candidatus Nomurabacteria bacterium GW2011_GWA1_37_20]